MTLLASLVNRLAGVRQRISVLFIDRREGFHPGIMQSVCELDKARAIGVDHGLNLFRTKLDAGIFRLLAFMGDETAVHDEEVRPFNQRNRAAADFLPLLGRPRAALFGAL